MGDPQRHAGRLSEWPVGIELLRCIGAERRRSPIVATACRHAEGRLPVVPSEVDWLWMAQRHLLVILSCR